MSDPEAFADMVVLTIKTALTPVLERLAVLEAQLKTVGDVRDRVVSMETKSALPLPEMPRVDLVPVLERVAVAEATVTRLEIAQSTLTELRDRVVSMETKAAIPVPVLETRTEGPSATEVELAITKAIAPVSERLAVLETKAPVPGPAGHNGQDGTPGVDGKNGADGFGFEDMEEVLEDGGRTVKRRYIKGDRVKEFVHKTAVLINRGVYLDGKSYEHGDVVTWGGSQWHCNEDTTTKPGDGLKAWTLIVKRGRDGKDGRDGVGALPIVNAVGRSL